MVVEGQSFHQEDFAVDPEAQVRSFRLEEMEEAGRQGDHPLEGMVEGL